MRFYLILICLLNLSTGLMAQVENIDCADAVQQCNHARGVSSTQNINYYQYPSMEKYDLKYLKLDLSAETGSRFISGTAYTESIALAPMDSFITEFKNTMTVDSVFVNGSKLSFDHSDDHIFIPLSPAIGAGSPVQTLIYYEGTASSAGVFTGTMGSLNYTATLSESYQAREWFPIKQLLKDKIDSADIWITTSAINKAGSNGLLVDSVDLPAGKKQYRWKTHYPMDYYLVSFAIGNYMEYDNYAKPASMAPDSILIQHYIMDDPSYLTSVKTNLDKTPPFIEKMSELYGLYPFSDEKYGHCLAQIGGGMEHQTMSTMNGFGSTLIAHELAHQWWGDHVTCATWNDIWLNEGFASYGEYLMIEKLPALFSTTPAPYMQSIHNNVMSFPTGSVYVPDASVYNESRIFSGRLTYNKGSAIIHNLRFEMEDDNLFFQTLQDFQQQYGDSVASATDFKEVAEATSGKDFTDFFDQWYYGEGYPTFNITYFIQGNDTIILLVNETVSASSVTPFFKGLFEFKITSPQGDTTVKVNLTANDQQFKFPYGKTPDGIIVDPNNWVLNQTGTIIDGGTVPIHVFDFENSTDAECNTTFKWKSTNELPGTRYDLEYSSDATTYSTLATLPGTSHPVSIYQYRALLNLEGLVYIRVKITEPGGRFYYSEVTSFQLNCHLPYSVSLTPNPVINTLTVSVRQPRGGKSEFSLLNEAGQLLYRSDKPLPAGISIVTIDMKTFAKGTYFLKIRSADGSPVTKRLVKL